jgi:16S rRNA (cytosine967-C5)-methyltransferase
VSGEKPREIAARVLDRYAHGAHYLEYILEPALAKSQLSPADRGLLQELTCGVVRWQATLDWLIDRKVQAGAPKLLVRILLRMGLYQVFWLSRIPEHAAVHETVELAKVLGCAGQAGFVNAVLRGYLREREATARWLDDLKKERPALGFSHPDWLCERWRARWGEEKLRALLHWNNTPPVLYARVNGLRADADMLRAQWGAEGVGFAARAWDWTGESLVFALESHPPLTSLLSFQHGWFYVQDPSTLLATRMLDPQPGERVLDWCAAPGGKTTFMAMLMRNEGRLVAQEIDEARREMLRQNCERLGITCVRILPADAPPLRARAGRREPFDRILVDAPCSNTGVMRRRLDLRWRLKEQEIARLSRLQLDLLRHAAQALKPGGTLVYSTCSLEPEENRGVVDRFLAAEPKFRLQTERMLLPFVDQVDGAYVARLERGAEAG